jgi:DNA-binding transcriptional LysR family regulator
MHGIDTRQQDLQGYRSIFCIIMIQSKLAPVVANSAYLIKHGLTRIPADLAKHECLIYSLLKSPRDWFFSSAQHGDESVRVSGRFRASSQEALVEASLSGLGIAILCDWHAEQHLQRGSLTMLLKNYTLSPYDINAVYAERRFVPQKVKRFIDYLRAHLNQRDPLMADRS